jgi:hypothetical protein
VHPGYVPHGFRSTFRDWAAERTNHANYVVEKGRRLRADWMRFCASPPVKTTDGNITPIRRKKDESDAGA